MKKLLSFLAIGVMMSGTSNGLLACDSTPEIPLQGTKPIEIQKNLEDEISLDQRILALLTV